MRKAVTLCFFILLWYNVFSQTFYGAAAHKLVPGADMVVKAPNLDIPVFIRFAPGSEMDLKLTQSWLKTYFSISDEMGFTLRKSETDMLGYTHYRYQQTCKAFPVHSNTFIFHVRDGLVRSMNGQLFSSIHVPVAVNLSEKDALKKAINFTGADIYKWQLPSEEKWLKYEKNDENATYYPAGELVMISSEKSGKTKNCRLAWKFDIYAHQPLSRRRVFVDAATGKVIKTLDRIMTENLESMANAPATALTKYKGTRNIMTDYTGTTYRLRETGRGLGVETYDLNNSTNYGNALDFTNATTSWTAVNADQIARDAHWGTEMTYDYYLNTFGRNSINNAGLKLLSYVHYSNNYANAFWDGDRMTYGDGDGSVGAFTTLDICAHEITHGLTEYTANLDYSYESGALNEGFSDIFGATVEFLSSPPFEAGNWLIGEDIGEAFRSMSNPNAYDQPDTYQGDSWYTGSQDNGGVHINSGVLNFWYYLLCQGGSGTNDNGDAYTVASITMEKAQRIAFRMLTVYLVNSSEFADARTASIQACTDLYGSCSPELMSTTNAWYAVGVGASYAASETTADFTSLSQNLCTGVPFTAQFSNLSSNANSYKWYFGDGTTGMDVNPTHIYTAGGTYNVALVAYGGACGSDSVFKTGFVRVGITVNGDTVCAPSSAQLSASGNGILKWYNSPSGNTLLGTGNNYTTPALSSTTTFYVADSVVQGQVFYGARTSKTTSGANNVTAEQGLVFTALQPFVLKSVKVYSTVSSAASRTISLKNSAGTTISSVTVTVPSGESRITLNLNIPAGTNLRLTAPGNSNFWRDQSSTENIYPITIPNVLSITTSTASSTPLRYYYYFYDWEVAVNCVSPRVPVTAVVSPLPTAAGIISGTANVCRNQMGMVYSVPAIQDATSYIWTLPSGATGSSSTNTITVNYSNFAESGNITVKGVNDCGEGAVSVLPVYVSTNTSSTISATSCGSYTAPDGNVYTTSGVKTAVIPSFGGCDSIITIHLTIYHNTSAAITASACDSYTAPDGTVYTSSGIRTAVIPDMNGCDSTITINLTVHHSSSSAITETVCETYTAPDGITHTSSGIITAVIPNSSGCDSVITINLTVNYNSTASQVTASACNSYIAPDGNVYTSSGIITAVIPNSAGCDSTITIDLTVNTVDAGITVNGPVITANDTGAVYQWLNCADSYSIIPGEISQSFTAPGSGNYAVQVTRGSCADTSECTEIVIQGISEQNSGAIAVYPNPVSDELFIEISGDKQPVYYEIYNATGQLVVKGYFSGKTIVETSGFSSGTYFVRLVTGQENHYRKVIRE